MQQNKTGVEPVLAIQGVGAQVKVRVIGQETLVAGAFEQEPHREPAGAPKGRQHPLGIHCEPAILAVDTASFAVMRCPPLVGVVRWKSSVWS